MQSIMFNTYQSKKVNKHWGFELWIADGKRTPYATKHILFRAGNRTSLQVHQFKYETNYVLNGSGVLHVSPEPFNIAEFLLVGMSAQEVQDYEQTFIRVNLEPGVIFDIPPTYVHRVIPTTDLEFIETSTTELDDVIRLQDDHGRTHGKIDYEHQ
jgi:mannose-6-phosphate isomerase-like protein (cupin superfamily)